MIPYSDHACRVCLVWNICDEPCCADIDYSYRCPRIKNPSRDVCRLSPDAAARGGGKSYTVHMVHKMEKEDFLAYVVEL